MEENKYLVIRIGPERCFYGWEKQENNETWNKPIGKPFGWTPTLINSTANENTNNYEERREWKPGKGYTGQKIRIIFEDPKGEQWNSKMNPVFIAQMEHLKTENERLSWFFDAVIQQTKSTANKDEFRKQLNNLVSMFYEARGMANPYYQTAAFNPDSSQSNKK